MTRAIVRDARRVLIAGFAIAAPTALVVSTPAVAPAARDALGFGFAGLPQTVTQAARVAIHNTTIAAAPLLCAFLVPKIGHRQRRSLHIVLATLLATNALVVGVAVGAYGFRAVAALAPHAPVEFCAFALAGGAYMHACRHDVGLPQLVGVTAIVGLLLTTGAVLEVFVKIGGEAR